VLITGGASGIGQACVRQALDAGHRVAATHHTSPADEVPEGALAVACDLRAEEAVDAAVAQVEERLGPVEVLVANAGTTLERSLTRLEDDDLRALFEVNVLGTVRMLRRVTPGMVRARWGRVVLISSMAAVLGVAGYANYASSKAALTGLARSAARELAPRRVTVNVVQPGYVDTAMIADLPRSEFEAFVPAGRYGTPEEVAAAVGFLTSEDAGFTTGAVLPVDGGLGTEGADQPVPTRRGRSARMG
jgi:3-oxoacyl-[acyl-carrier protein] reductase